MDKYKKTRNILIVISIMMIFISIVFLILDLSGRILNTTFKFVQSLGNIIFIIDICFAIWYNKKKRDLEGPEYRVMGRVISKRNATDPVRNPLMLPEDWFCYITFRFDDNTVHELCTSAHYFVFLKIDQYGLLTYKNINGELKLMNFQDKATISNDSMF